jgi:hypothetical protein
MKLSYWRGENVLLTDPVGAPILKLDARGNVTEAFGRPPPTEPAVEVRSIPRLVASVALWIEWTAIEHGEFRLVDLHPELRDGIARLIPEYFVECAAA